MKLDKNCKFEIINNFGNEEEVKYSIRFVKDAFKKIGIKFTEKKSDFKIELIKNPKIKNGFKINTLLPEKIIISSTNSEGIRCGLFYFLELLGFRWFSPDKDLICPKLPLKINNINKKITPSFPYRGLHICGKNHFDAKVAEWMSFLKMNRKLTHHEEIKIVGDKLKKLGLKPDLTVHSYSFWIPDEKYFQKHPEWFSLVGNKRIKQKEGGQLCLSNKKMRNEFFKNIIKFIKKNPEISVVGICPNDGYGWCECEDCRKLDAEKDKKNNDVNGRIYNFVSDICERVKKVLPEILIGHYSYSNFKDFYLLGKMPDNLIISFTLSRCFKHSIDDTTCPINYHLYKKLHEARKRVKHIYVYEYYIHNWETLPSPTWKIVYKDMKAYKKIGIDGFLSEVTGVNTEVYKTNHLPLYIAGKLLFNNKENLENIIDDYCKKRFGPAFNFMKLYLYTLQKGLEKMEGCFTHKPEELKKMLTPEIRKECKKILKKAYLKVKKFKVYKKEVKEEIEIFNYFDFILKEREKYKIAEPIKIKKVDSINLNLKIDKKFLLLDKLSLIPPPKNKTYFEIFSNEKEIGFLIDCYEENMKDILILKGNSLSEVYGSENVEIFISNSKDSEKIYHFLINPDGYFCVSECYGKTWNWSWKGNFEIKTKKFLNKWRVLLKINRNTFGITTSLFFNIVRNRHAQNKWEITGFPEGGVFFDKNLYVEGVLEI